jgi:hypothetical protein
VFEYDEDHKEPYPSSLPGFFPGNASFSKYYGIIYINLFYIKCTISIINCFIHNLDIPYCRCRTEVYRAPALEGPRYIVKGLCNGVQLGVKAMPGFPSLQTLKHTAKLLHHGVNVFNSESKYVFKF